MPHLFAVAIETTGMTYALVSDVPDEALTNQQLLNEIVATTARMLFVSRHEPKRSRYEGGAIGFALKRVSASYALAKDRVACEAVADMHRRKRLRA